MSSRPPNEMAKSSIENSGLLITRTLHRHKHQLRDFFNRHACLRQQSSDRALRLFGAVQLSAVVIYFLGFGLGLYR